MTKERLNDFRKLARAADKQREALALLESSLYSVRGVNFSPVPRGHSSHGRALEDKISRHIQLCENYAGTLCELYREQLHIEQALDKVPYPEKLILRARYISGLNWEKVCSDLGYEWSQAHRLHAAGLKFLQDQPDGTATTKGGN